MFRFQSNRYIFDTMKIAVNIFKLLIVIATLLYATTYIVLSVTFYGPTTLFSIPNPPQTQIFGYIMLAVSIVMTVSSFLIFKKDNLKYFVILVIGVVILLISFLIIENFSGEMILFNIAYAILVSALYAGSLHTEKKLLSTIQQDQKRDSS